MNLPDNLLHTPDLAILQQRLKEQGGWKNVELEAMNHRTCPHSERYADATSWGWYMEIRAEVRK